MNVVIYLVLWALIGLVAGYIASILSCDDGWDCFFAHLVVGFAGAIGAGYFLSRGLFGMQVTLSAYSLVLAIFGATILLGALWALRRLYR